MPDFEKATDINFQWSAGEVCFDCPCGEKEIMFIEGGDTHICECGRVYQLVHYVLVKMPEIEAKQ